MDLCDVETKKILSTQQEFLTYCQVSASLWL
jgi:hypothetical protein